METYEDQFVSMEHLLLAAIETNEITQQFVGNKDEVIKEIIKRVRGGNHVTSQNPEANYEAYVSMIFSALLKSVFVLLPIY